MNHISVTGTGSAAAAPDVVILNVGIEVLARSVAEARVKAAADVAEVLTALRFHGIDDGDLATAALSIHPEYDHREGRRLRGYRVGHSIEATIREVDIVGKVIDAVAAAGEDSIVIHGIRFSHDDPAELESRARKRAWDSAQGKAEQLAELSGVGLGSAVAVSEQMGDGSPHPPGRAMAMEAASVATPIEASELAVTVTINVDFAIE